ncbi:MAG: hypothetical protein Q4A01_03220 [Coriobacteriales bacterium]|nr:hypothetical protein [Coriobacteriales bacterium]
MRPRDTRDSLRMDRARTLLAILVIVVAIVGACLMGVLESVVVCGIGAAISSLVMMHHTAKLQRRQEEERRHAAMADSTVSMQERELEQDGQPAQETHAPDPVSESMQEPAATDASGQTVTGSEPERAGASDKAHATLDVSTAREASAPSDHAPEPAGTQQPVFSFDAFRLDVLTSDEPLEFLRDFVRSTQGASDGDASPSAFEQYLAKQLEESGLLDADEELGEVRMVWPRHSQLFYLRCPPGKITYASYLTALRIEAALNMALFASRYYHDTATANLEDLYRLQARILRSVCSQAPDVETADWGYLAMPWQSSHGPQALGEWSLRQSIAEAIEGAQVPYRLEASFRSNVSAGDVAIQTTYVPPLVFPRSTFAQDLGIVPTTSQMRSREASRYAASIGILLAASAFRANSRIRRVWVSCVEETPSRHVCRYSVCFDRRAFSRLRLDAIGDPVQVLADFGAPSVDDVDGLLPTEPCFYLEDERFCPHMRHDLWHLSERSLNTQATLMLGANRVSDLIIHEELPRSVAADSILSRLEGSQRASSAEQSVRAILDVAHATSDFSVLDATERLVGKIVDGKVDPADEHAVRDELMHGDVLSRTVERAQSLAQAGEHREALSLLQAELRRIDQSGWYDDTKVIACRSFDSFAERCLYNRMHRGDGRSVMLVPDAYVMAHLFASALIVGSQEPSEGLLQDAQAHAQRALSVAPLSPVAHLGMVACLEQLGDLDGAAEQLVSLLEVSFTPQSIGMAYYRMAAIQFMRDEFAACQACYLQSARVFAPLAPLIAAECQMLIAHGMPFDQDMDADKIEQTLEQHHIPFAPTEHTSYALYECAAASVDAEVFPVASELLRVLEQLTGDDVIRCMRQSIEREPDE